MQAGPFLKFLDWGSGILMLFVVFDDFLEFELNKKKRKLGRIIQNGYYSTLFWATHTN